jgi:hypothetical protein
MILLYVQQKWGHLWTISKKNWQRYKFYTFPISFKEEIVYLIANPILYAAFFHTYVGINFNIFVERNYFLIFFGIYQSSSGNE